MTVSEAAKALGLSDRTIRNWLRAGKVVASQRPNGTVVFSPRQLEWLRLFSERKEPVKL